MSKHSSTDSGNDNPPNTRGAQFEALAAAWCQAQGWRILARNVRCRRGEIDLIALDGATLVFVEVRQRRSSRFGTAIETVDARKRRRIALTAQYWLVGAGRAHAHRAMRFDVLTFTEASAPPQHWRAAFRLEDAGWS